MKYQVREKIFRLGEDNDILNEAGQPVLQVDGKVLSLHGLMLVNDLAGTEVGRVSRKLVSLLATYDITLSGGISAELHQRFSGPFHPKWTIAVAGGTDMEMTGNFAGHDFIITENGQTVATVSKAWISLANSYGVDIVAGQNDLLILCSVWRWKPSRIGATTTTAAKVSLASSADWVGWREAAVLGRS